MRLSFRCPGLAGPWRPAANLDTVSIAVCWTGAFRKREARGRRVVTREEPKTGMPSARKKRVVRCRGRSRLAPGQSTLALIEKQKG